MSYRRTGSVKKLLLAALAGVASLALIAPAIADSTVVVTPTNMQGWAFGPENTPSGSGGMVSGPETPPLGDGSANFVLSAANQGYNLGAANHQGVMLANVDTLEYSTYRTSGGAAQAIALQFNIDYDSTDGNAGFQGRLVYEPYHTHTVLTGDWQTWDTLDDAPNGNWWGTPGGGFRPGATTCPQSNPCTWSEVLGLYPNARVHPTLGAVILKAGSGWASFDGNADALIIEVNGDATTYDFELNSVPTSTDECKRGGWKLFNPPSGPFKNQGDCVSYVASHGRAGGNP